MSQSASTINFVKSVAKEADITLDDAAAAKAAQEIADNIHSFEPGDPNYDAEYADMTYTYFGI